MSTLAKVRARAAELGAVLEVERDGDRITVNVDAPAGYIWASWGTHYICEFTYGGNRGDAAEVYGRTLAGMAMGVRACEEPDCEVCSEDAAEREEKRHFREHG